MVAASEDSDPAHSALVRSIRGVNELLTLDGAPQGSGQEVDGACGRSGHALRVLLIPPRTPYSNERDWGGKQTNQQTTQGFGTVALHIELVFWLAYKPWQLCSNRAATRVNLLKSWELRRRRNTAVCGKFASSRNLQQTNLTRFVRYHSCNPSR